jgi:ADP-ribose pyrophosphatase
MSPGILSERMHVYLASGLTAGKIALEAGEQIEPLLLSLADALQMIELGEIHDAKTIAALLFYERFRQKVDA